MVPLSTCHLEQQTISPVVSSRNWGILTGCEGCRQDSQWQLLPTKALVLHWVQGLREAQPALIAAVPCCRQVREAKTNLCQVKLQLQHFGAVCLLSHRLSSCPELLPLSQAGSGINAKCHQGGIVAFIVQFILHLLSLKRFCSCRGLGGCWDRTPKHKRT